MGKEANLLDAARTGNLQVLSKYITKAKAGSARAKPHKKLSFFALHQPGHPHRRRSTGMSRSSGWLDCCDLNGETPLHLAALNSHRAAVILLMNGGAQVNIRDNQGCLPVHLAAWTGNVDICQSLLHLQAHTEINAQNRAGDTALHIASQYGHTAVVRLLLKHGANPMIRNIRGESSLDLSAFYGRLETVSLLINEQPALMQQIQHSHSPLHLAARNGQKDVVRKLLQSGYNINARTMSGSALHEAATYGKVAIMKQLVQSGIDKSIKDNNNQTAEEMLEGHGSVMSKSLLAAIRGEENLYHSLNDTASNQTSNQTLPSGTNNRYRLCKHGKIIREDTKHPRTRERSSSGQTSGSGSSPPMSPPPALPDESNQLFRHHSEWIDQRSHQLSSDKHSPVAITTNSSQPSSHDCANDNLQWRSMNGHHGHSGQPSATLHTQHSKTELSYGRHMSCSAHMPNTCKHSDVHSNCSGQKCPERSRHKSASAATSDYIKLSETTTFSVKNTHIYNQIVAPTCDHDYDKMESTSSLSDTPIYDSLPQPCPVVSRSHLMESQLDLHSVSPSFYSSANASSVDVFSDRSEDSIYNSQGSLSQEGTGTCKRRGLGHIYVNLSTYRSTPDLLQLDALKPPQKPPRTLDQDDQSCNSADYVGVEIDSAYLSRSQVVLSSNSSQQPFMLPPFASLAEAESRNDVNAHAYENMPAVVESQSVKCKSPPKAMPRKSKSKDSTHKSLRNNNNYENTIDDVSITGFSVYTCSSVATAEEEENR
ncbi:uncharacterized protein [Watersipora subatra]|uniref:uncharacterized protein n=1 Tax=Watersipora subatra TaxID=2589382 RepID=UPI00355B7CE9